jgi:hypothetical protein
MEKNETLSGDKPRPWQSYHTVYTNAKAGNKNLYTGWFIHNYFTSYLQILDIFIRVSLLFDRCWLCFIGN